MEKPRVLSTKKLEPGLAREAAKNYRFTEVEFIRTRSIQTKAKWDELIPLLQTEKLNVIFTSARAVEAVKKYLHPYVSTQPVSWKIFSLQGRTAEAVRECFGEASIVATAAHAGALAVRVKEHHPERIVFFCGDQRRDELPSLLQEAGIAMEEVVLYTTEESPVRINDPFDAVLFFSPSAVRSFFSLNQLKEDVVCFAVGATTAGCLASHTRSRIITSEAASQEALMDAVNQYFK